MPGTNRSIGGQGLEQGGPNLGNDISRNISREVQADDTAAAVVKNKQQHQQDVAANEEEHTQEQELQNEDDEQ